MNNISLSILPLWELKAEEKIFLEIRLWSMRLRINSHLLFSHKLLLWNTFHRRAKLVWDFSMPGVNIYDFFLKIFLLKHMDFSICFNFDYSYVARLWEVLMLVKCSADFPQSSYLLLSLPQYIFELSILSEICNI